MSRMNLVKKWTDVSAIGHKSAAHQSYVGHPEIPQGVADAIRELTDLMPSGYAVAVTTSGQVDPTGGEATTVTITVSTQPIVPTQADAAAAKAKADAQIASDAEAAKANAGTV